MKKYIGANEFLRTNLKDIMEKNLMIIYRPRLIIAVFAFWRLKSAIENRGFSIWQISMHSLLRMEHDFEELWQDTSFLIRRAVEPLSTQVYMDILPNIVCMKIFNLKCSILIQ